MKKIHLILLSCLSGILFTLGWPVNGFPAFLFTALVPMFIIEDYIYKNKDDFSKFSVFFYTFTGFFVWNFLTTYWVWNSTPAATMAWTFNSMFMGIVFNVYHIIRRNVYQNNQGYFVVVFLWITFEYIHLNWNLTWAWLNLGHGFAVYSKWIQWYEYTGILGGTAWVIIVNILLFKAIKEFIVLKSGIQKLLLKSSIVLGLIIIPIFVSYLIYYNYEEKVNPVGIVLTQPNIDPYSEQYSLPPMEMLDRNLSLVEEVIDDNTMFIVAPESAIQEGIWESQLYNSPSLTELTKYVLENPDLNVIIGASTYQKLKEGDQIPNTARFHSGGNFYYNRFNTAFLIDSSQTFQKHHKSKLTPGVEWLPSWGPFSFIENLAIDLGGTVGSIAIDKEQIPFVIKDTMLLAPLICYESVYGEFCGNFVKNGASIFLIITNDGWWGNTPGHKQHFTFAPLRAIEHRRSIARSANTGISAFINQRGDVFQRTKYWEPDVIKQDLNLNHEVTFYSQMGDYLGRVSAFLSVIFILISVVFGIRKKKQLK